MEKELGVGEIVNTDKSDVITMIVNGLLFYDRRERLGFIEELLTRMVSISMGLDEGAFYANICNQVYEECNKLDIK